jgi:hypothetical protein
MSVVPPLTREQCQVIVEHYERRVQDAVVAQARYTQATEEPPILSVQSMPIRSIAK